MMFAINKDNFDGRQEVTCYACHRGAHKPVITPIVGEEAGHLVGEKKISHELPNTANLPTADQVLGKYLQTVGGAEAAAKISTRIQKGTLTVGSERFAVEVLSKGPANRVTKVHFVGGDSVTGINETEGWLTASGGSVHEMSPSEVDAARMDAELFFPTALNRIFKQLRVEQSRRINGRDAYVLAGVRENLPTVQLFFDQQSGLLMRVLRFVETPLGCYPTEIDYADYREQDGVKTPFRWTIARPNGSFTIQIEQMQQNLQIKKDEFTKPPTSP